MLKGSETTGGSRLPAKWTALAAAGTAAGLAASQASAGIIYTPTNITIDSAGVAGATSATLNMFTFYGSLGGSIDNRPFATFKASSTNGITVAKPSASGSIGVLVNADAQGGFVATAFPAGSSISPASPYTAASTTASNAISLISAAGTTGNFTEAAGLEYIGFEFNGVPQYHAGWIAFQTLTTTADGGSVTGVIKGYAVETSQLTPIAAGAIPEPSSLSLLALGATGLATYRGRKKTA